MKGKYKGTGHDVSKSRNRLAEEEAQYDVCSTCYKDMGREKAHRQSWHAATLATGSLHRKVKQIQIQFLHILIPMDLKMSIIPGFLTAEGVNAGNKVAIFLKPGRP